MIYRCLVFSIVSTLLCTIGTTLISANTNENNSKPKFNPYKDIENKIHAIKKQCGSLCEINSSNYEPISEDSRFYYVPIKKDVNCKDLWNSSIFDETTKFKEAIQKLPVYLKQYFSFNNMVDIKPHYFDEKKTNIWNDTFNTWGKV